MNANPSTTRAENIWQRRLARSAKRLPAWETVAALAVGAVLWVILAHVTPPFVLPQLDVAIARVIEVFTDADQRWNWLVTIGRVMLGLVSAFVVGVVGGLLMAQSKRLTNILMPYLQIIQGIPSLAWVLIAATWFTEAEVRIWFLMLMVTLPGFVFQTRDSYQAIPQELRDMAKSLRPRRSRLDMFRTLTLPAITPGLLTAWRVNLGLGTRVVIIAEYAGTTIGVGIQMRSEQALLRMDGILAWTASLVIFVLIIQWLIERVERHLLRYRPGANTATATDADQPDQPLQPVGGPAGSDAGTPDRTSPTTFGGGSSR